MPLAGCQPLLAFLFETPLAAFGTLGAAMALPVLIYLINRRRYRVVNWAAMRFLLAARRRNLRRLRLEQLLLLAVRMLLMALLVTAMLSVTPWAEAVWGRCVPEQAATTVLIHRRTHKILVLDGSFSMAMKNQETSAFERGRKLAQQIIAESAGGDGFSVVLMASPPRRIVTEPSDDARRVGAEIQDLKLPHGNADLAATLNMVDDLLRRSPPKYEEREVYFLTDLQRATWTTRQTLDLSPVLQRLQARARLVLVDVGQEGVTNTAVTQLALGVPFATTGTETTFTAVLHLHGTQPRNQVRVELLVGKGRESSKDRPFTSRAVQQVLVDLKPGANPLSFAHKFITSGDYAVQVRVEADALELDDARTVIVSVKDTLPVLLVNGKPGAELYDRATEWLRDALNPFREGLIPRNVPARPRVIRASDFADAGLGDLTPFDCVFLCDVPSVGRPEAARLEAHLRRGGGVVFCLGPNVQLDAYNRVLWNNGDGILPARLLARQEAPERHYFRFHVEERGTAHPLLGAFGGDADRVSLTSARFAQYIRTELAPRGQARAILRFMPEVADTVPRADLPLGDAAWIEGTRRRGRVLLFTSTVNMDWTSWPLSPSFPAFLHEALHYAVAGRLREQAVTVGDSLEEVLPPGTSGLEVELVLPDGRKESFRTLARDEFGLLRWTDTDVSGIYRATLGSHPREHLFAVNVSSATETQQASESDPQRTNRNELQSAFPAWEPQIVTNPRDVVRIREARAADTPAKPIASGLGKSVAHWLLVVALLLLLIEVMLAWRFGHHNPDQPALLSPTTLASRVIDRGIAVLASGVLVGILLPLGLILMHTASTGDFLGFLPDSARTQIESRLGVPAAAPGEGSHWSLEFTPYLWDADADPWLAGAFALAAGAFIVGIYWREGQIASRGTKLLLASLRLGLVLLALSVLLPQLQLWFEREGWPELAIVLDDSRSMATVDQHNDPHVQEAAERLAKNLGLSQADRFQLARALLVGSEPDWLETLVSQRKTRVHLYRASEQVARLGDMTAVGQRADLVDEIAKVRPDGDASRLGVAVRQVLNDARGASLSAVIVLTDGITTEGEDLVKVSRYAAGRGVPLYYVGVGAAHEARDLILHDLRVEDAVFANDRLVFEARVTSQGYPEARTLPVHLREKGKDQVLATTQVKLDPTGKPVRFRLTHQPKEAGEKVYVLDLPVQKDEARSANNRLERMVFVREAKIIKVLYVEGSARYEFRFIKHLLERESGQDRRNKAIDLKVLLLDADPDFPAEDRSALPHFPLREELNGYDVVILGDVDPRDPKVEKHLPALADFTRERGGGFLMIAGTRFAPHAYRDTVLRDILPVEPLGTMPPDTERPTTYRPELTPAGRFHPLFRFSPDDAENSAIWNRLAPLHWWSEGYRLKPAAEALLVHPERPALDPLRGGARGPERHPLMAQQFVGAGRSMFFGIDETWRWRLRDDEVRFNQFWIQTIRHLARSRLGRIDLRLDKQTPYRRGEPIRVTVRFPDDAPAPGPEVEVKVMVERRQPGQGEIERETVRLAKTEGSRASYETVLTRTPEGDYRIWLSGPDVPNPKPRAEAVVLPPPGELEQVRMNQADMERSAEETRGRFYTLATADRLLDELPPGTRITLRTPQPPLLLWNHAAVFALAAALFALEWGLRKRKHLV